MRLVLSLKNLKKKNFLNLKKKILKFSKKNFQKLKKKKNEEVNDCLRKANNG